MNWRSGTINDLRNAGDLPDLLVQGTQNVNIYPVNWLQYTSNYHMDQLHDYRPAKQY